MGAMRKRAFSAAVEAASLQRREGLEGCVCRGGEAVKEAAARAEAPPRGEALREGPEAEVRESRAEVAKVCRRDAEIIEDWRRAVAALAEGAAKRQDRLDLELVLGQDRDRPRCELVQHGDRPVLVTAPHAIYVLRDGHTPHLVERHTSEIAHAIASELKGTCLQWSEEERRRSKLLWDAAERCGVAEGSLLDPRNRDPNYLSTEELLTNQWHKLMLTSSTGWTRALGYGQAKLHIDVHGCRDPPETPSHLTIGLGAMLLQAEREGPTAVARVEAFGAALKAELLAEVASLGFARLQPVPEPVRVLLPYGGDLSGSCARFSGAWPEDAGRLTQSQQAVGCAGFSHSIQLEISRSLRNALMDHKTAPLRFGNALRTAWAKAKRSGEGAGTVAG